jgi:hypothetical protein
MRRADTIHLRFLRPPDLRSAGAFGTPFLLGFLGGEGVRAGREWVGEGECASGGRFSICVSGKIVILRVRPPSLADEATSAHSVNSPSLSWAIREWALFLLIATGTA